MRKNIIFIFSLVCSLCSVAGCSKESPVVEKRFASLALNAFTVDPYRFRVSLSNEVVTDSLITPEGKASKEVFFYGYQQRIKVYNTSDETLLIDTPYTLHTGAGVINAFTIYQTEAGTPPFYLAPLPSEPKPGTDSAKFSIICSGLLPTDSVKAVVEIQNKRVDSVRLKKDNFSRYFRVPVKISSKIILYPIPGNNTNSIGEKVLENNTFLPGDLAIYRLTYNGTSSLIPQKLY